ncbi:MAG: hypothetical protein COA43_16500 [Robiginitomaculum sp.]|nr:MAG: hypothetical protein COA43_16500 [Robiginitomaculum sp.]
MRTGIVILFGLSVGLSSCAVKLPKIPKLPKKPAFSFVHADDTLAFLQERIATSKTYHGDTLVICSENPKTKLRTVIVPELYFPKLYSTESGTLNNVPQTEMVWVPTPKGAAKSLCYRYNKTDTQCLVKRDIVGSTVNAGDGSSDRIAVARHITYVNRKGYLVTSRGKRLKALRSNAPTFAHTCEGL